MKKTGIWKTAGFASVVFLIFIGCSDFEVKHADVKNVSEKVLKFDGYLITNQQMEENLVGFLGALENDGRSVLSNEISLELMCTDKIETNASQNERTVTDSIESVDFFLYKVEEADETKYALTSNDLRIGTVIAVMDDIGNSDEGNVFWGIFTEQLEMYVNQTIQNWEQENAERSAASNIVTSGDYTYTDWDFKSGMKDKYLIKTKWGQGEPYNKITLEQYGENGDATGCGPVAVAQLCAYYNWPKTCTTAPYKGTEYEWYEMKKKPLAKDVDKKYRDEISILMYELGKKQDADYIGGEEGTSVKSNKLLTALSNDGWNYKTEVHHQNRAPDTHVAWLGYNYDYVVESLKHSKPVLCDGKDKIKDKYSFLGITLHTSYEPGHFWLIDGYAECSCTVTNKKTNETSMLNEKFIHCNLGWGGLSDGYYLSGVFDARDGHVPLERSGSSDYYQYNLKFIYDLYHEGNIVKTLFSSLTDDCTVDIPPEFTAEDIPELNDTLKRFPHSVTLNFKNAVNLTELPPGSFLGCRNIKSVILPETLTSIGNTAFSGCSSLKSITILSSTVNIRAMSFYDCRSLESITVPFSALGSVIPALRKETKIIVSDGISSSDFHILRQALLNSSYMINLDLSKTWISVIPDNALSRCTMLKSVSLPQYITRIGTDAFYDCDSLSSISVPYYASGRSYTTVDTVVSALPVNTALIITGSPSLPKIKNALNKSGSKINLDLSKSKGIVKLSSGAFKDCASLKSIILPSTVTSIGQDAFAGCNLLTDVTLKNTSGWYRTTSLTEWENKNGGVAEDVSDSAINAEYLKNTYTNSYWYWIDLGYAK